MPDVTFSDRMTLALGGKQVELIHVGRNHSDNSIVMLFPEERTSPSTSCRPRLPYRNLSDSYYPDWVDSLRRVERLDFLAPGHGAMGTKQDVVDHRRYHEDLYNAVVAAAREGQSLEEEGVDRRRVQGLGLFRRLARVQHRRGLRPRRAATPGELSVQ